MLFPVLKDSERASAVVQQMWLRGRKDYESNVPVLDFGEAIGGYSIEAMVLQTKCLMYSKDMKLLLLRLPPTWICKLKVVVIQPTTQPLLSTLFSSFFESFFLLFFSFLYFFNTNKGADNKWKQHDICEYGD